MPDYELRIPPEARTMAEKSLYCERARELLRRIFNAQTELDPDEAARWAREWFRPRNNAVSEAILTLRRTAKEQARSEDDTTLEHAVDLDTAFVEDIVPVVDR